MAGDFDDSDFVDHDFEATAGSSAPVSSPAARAPSREELVEQVRAKQSRLSELKHEQEELERQRTHLEDAKRRQSEFENGRDEMTAFLGRGIGLLEEKQFAAKKDADQMLSTLETLRESLTKVEGINESSWSQDDWNAELSRAMASIENARMEWNTARIKWSFLNDAHDTVKEENAGPNRPFRPLTEPQTFPQLCRVGFALTWPVLLAGLLVFTALLIK